MHLGGKFLRVGALSLTAVVAAAGTWIVTTSAPDEPLFCQASLALVMIDGRSVAPQDQTGPGEDERCDFDQTEAGHLVLGYDCKIRQPDGEVEVELVPNRNDGTCGLPQAEGERIPDPWPKR